MQNRICPFCDIRIMGNDYDDTSIFMCHAHQIIHNVSGVFCIQISCWLVCQNDIAPLC